MAKFERGDRVMATKDIGGLFSRNVDKGDEGVITETHWGSGLTVNFDGHEVKCDEDDVARIERH